MLPAEVFPTAVRTTFFGLSAGMAKVGALIGSASFEGIQNAIGLDGVYYVCAGVSLAGMVVTYFLVPREANEPDRDTVSHTDSLINADPQDTDRA